MGMRGYQVGDYDWFVATSPEQAMELMREIGGDEDWDASDYEVTLSSDELLDKRLREEDVPVKDAGSLREWLAEPNRRVGSTASSHGKRSAMKPSIRVIASYKPSGWFFLTLNKALP